MRITTLQSTSGTGSVDDLSAGFRQYEGKMASTMGKPVDGDSDPPAIPVKLMSSIARELSIPLCYLRPVPPSGVKDRVIVIAGDSDDVGLEGVVVDCGPGEDGNWYVRLSKDAGTTQGRPETVVAKRQHLAVCGKVQVRA